MGVEISVPRDRRELVAATGLLNRELGEGMYSEVGLTEDAGSGGAVVLVAREGRSLAGAAVGRILGPGDGGYYAAFGRAAADLFARHPRVGSLEALAVEPAARGRGIGLRLVSDRIGWLARQGCGAVVAVSWVSGRAGSSAPLFRRLNLRETGPVADFYAQDSLDHGWSCPVDGRPCHCAAILFWATNLAFLPLV